MKKKGQMQIEVLVALVMGVLVLAFGIFGFITNWDMFNNKVCIFGNCYSNVESVQNECKLACIDNDKETYCEKEIKLKLNENKIEKGTCESFSNQPFDGFEIEPCINICNYKE